MSLTKNVNRSTIDTIAITSLGLILVSAVIHFVVKRKEKNGGGEVQNEEVDTERRKSDCSNAFRRRTTLEDEIGNIYEDGLNVKPIGVVRSVYKLCVGTPRQGLLVPHSKGRIELISHYEGGLINSEDAVLGLEGYSHIWIVFVFHLNTKSSSSSTQTRSKISPPALGGQKVGVLATRTPHRPNPIGITLCKLDRITRRQVVANALNRTATDKKKNKPIFKTVLEISGIDLVDGTPVLDIKPYVPHYDTVDYLDQRQQQQNTIDVDKGVQVPGWVSHGLSKRRDVKILPKAQKELELIILKQEESTNKNNVLEFYGNKTSHTNLATTTSSPDSEVVDNIVSCIREVLSIDVRSTYQTNKLRSNKFQAERSNRITKKQINHEQPQDQICTQQIDNLLVYFTVKEPLSLSEISTLDTNASVSDGSKAKDGENIGNTSSIGSGAEDIVIVQSIQLLV